MLKRFQSCSLPVLFLLPAWLNGPVAKSIAQESLPPLSIPFRVPETEPNASPFEDEKPSADGLMDNQSANELAANSGSLNNLFSHQWVRTSSDLSLSGSVVTLVGQDTLSVSGTKVTLAQQGRAVSTAVSDTNGEFRFRNVAPGYYSIIAEADNTFATYGLAVMESDRGSHLPSTIELRVIRPKSEDIRRILRADAVPSQVSSTETRNVLDPISAKRVFAKSHRVMAKGGKIVGRLSRLGMSPELVDMSQMKAILLKDGREIMRSDVTRDGAFEFQGVEPGCYGFAAAGNKGIAAVAFCVVASDSLSQFRSNRKVRLVSTVQEEDATSELNVELADNADVLSIRDTLTEPKPEEEEVVAEEESRSPPPMMPYGGSNMFGAGQVINGGPSGFEGVFGNLIGLGIAGGIAWALVEEFNDDDAIVSPITQ